MSGSTETASLSWLGIVRLGLVQTALGAIFVLSTSTLNRVMKVELDLPAIVPGALIALQYAVQVLRPRFGHGSDVGGRRTPMILGGMATLAGGGVLAAVATGTMRRDLPLGVALAVAAFLVIGLGVSAAGTALLTLLATRTAPERRPAAATIAWIMMIAGFIVTAAIAGRLLDPFSPQRLLVVAAAISTVALAVSALAVRHVEPRALALASPTPGTPTREPFARTLAGLWAETPARRFALFVFVSMLAYGGEEVMIEPFAGSVFGWTLGQTARLNGMLHQGSLVGMVLVPLVCAFFKGRVVAALNGWMVVGCLGSAAALAGLAAVGVAHTPALLAPAVFALGLANGGYAIAAIGSMMQRVGGAHQGARMGLWGAAQAVAFGGGTLAATALADLAHLMMRQGHAPQATTYAAVFVAQGIAFVVAATLAGRLGGTSGAVDAEPRTAIAGHAA